MKVWYFWQGISSKKLGLKGLLLGLSYKFGLSGGETNSSKASWMVINQRTINKLISEYLIFHTT